MSTFANIEIETLTPIHIGNGNLISGSELVRYQNANGQKCIGVLDFSKIMQSVKEYNLNEVEFTNKWISSIKNNIDFKSFMLREIQAVKPIDYIKRQIVIKGIDYKESQIPNSPLKELIHDGRGFPYIPGSSLKGAIRTAIITDLMINKELNNQSAVIDILKARDKKDGNLLNRFDEKEGLSRLLNKYVGDAKRLENDFFRFIQIGDAYFENYNLEEALMGICLNYKDEEESLIDDNEGTKQLFEVIKSGVKSEFVIKLDVNRFQKLALKDEINFIPEGYNSIEKIFKIINDNIKFLIEDEIDLWESYMTNNNKIDADLYIESLESIQSIINNLSDKECVIRIGAGSGWRFTTGSWAEELTENDFFVEKIVPCINHHDANYYQNCYFPKSRRIYGNGRMFGFVKLKIK